MGKKHSYLYCFITLYLVLNLLPIAGICQAKKTDRPGDIVAALNNKSKHQNIEKLYVQLDRSWYKHGDTLWYKAYLLNRNLSASLQSGLIYIELINDSSRVVKRQMIKANGGVAAGDIEIKRKFIPGTYTLRAYTNWMRNF